MNFLTLTSLLAAITAASGSSLRGDFETDVVDTSSRNLQNCVARSSYLGCFKNQNNDRAMSFQVADRNHSALTCESACTSKGYTFFAREWKGQCFCSNDTDYDKHGSRTGCDCCGDDVGGNLMCVWMVGDSAPGCDGNGAPSSTYLGCYENKNRDRALPYKIDGQNHSAKDCQDACSKKDLKYFAREYKGQCFCSDNSDFSKHGSASDCDCCGSNVGGNKMCVWSN